MTPKIKALPPMRLAYLRHTGPFGGPSIGDTWMRFTAWCAEAGLSTATQETYGISQDDPSRVPQSLLRYDCCIQVDAAFQPTGDIQVQDFPGGRYAVVDFYGIPGDMPFAWMRLMALTLHEAGLKAAPKACLEIYPPDFEVNTTTGTFECELAAPLKGK